MTKSLDKNKIQEQFGKVEWEGFISIMERKFSEAIEDMEDQLHDCVFERCPIDVREDVWTWNVWDLIIEEAIETWGFFSNRRD